MKQYLKYLAKYLSCICLRNCINSETRPPFFIVLSMILPMALPINAIADNEVRIDIGKAQVKRSLMALTPLKYLGSQPTNTNIERGKYLYKVIYNDLNTSSYFRFISPDAYIENPDKVGLKPAPGQPNGFNYKNWTVLGTEFLLRTGYRVLKNQVEVETYLYYVPQGRLVFNKIYRSLKNDINARKLAHSLASDIIKKLTGKPAMFNSKIVFSSDRTKNKEIYVMDWDGFNQQRVTHHKSIALSPSWSPDGQAVIYTAYAYHPKIKSKNADLFLYDLKSKKRWLVSYRRGNQLGGFISPKWKRTPTYDFKKWRP